MDRDYSMFGQYDVKLGARVYSDTTVTAPVSLGQWDTEYTLSEPDYTSGEATETDYSELNYMEIDQK